MNSYARISWRFLSIVAVGAIISSLHANAASPAGDLANGKQLFQNNCSICHKANGTGGESIGKAVSADINGATLEASYLHRDSLIARAILDGLDAHGQQLDKVMPRYRGHATPQQVADLIAYLKSLREIRVWTYNLIQ
jgi:mono/diheme cytochrome c family protein